MGWLYQNDIKGFLNDKDETVLGFLCSRYHGGMLTTTLEAWSGEIRILKSLFANDFDPNGKVIFEYDIPRLGKRADVILLYRGIIFCLEFKVGKGEVLQQDVDQVLDYALDLKNFHKLSEPRLIVPILIATRWPNATRTLLLSAYDDRVVNPLICGESGLKDVIDLVLERYPNEREIEEQWALSPYAPTPTIIEAARTLYQNHSVDNITRHLADKVDTDRTIDYLLSVIKESEQEKKKSICFVTGVPGGGQDACRA
ncbi:MAG: hypothetical protein ACI32C_03845 [Candidatus Enteromonas sp.]